MGRSPTDTVGACFVGFKKHCFFLMLPVLSVAWRGQTKFNGAPADCGSILHRQFKLGTIYSKVFALQTEAPTP